MDQYQCRGKLLKNFQDHWSIQISPGKGMDQWRSKFSESFSLDRYWSIECSSLKEIDEKRGETLAKYSVDFRPSISRAERTEIAAIFAICDCDAHRGPLKSLAISETRRNSTALRLRGRWKVSSDLRFGAAISEPETPSFCGIAGDLGPSTRKSLAIAIVRFSSFNFQGNWPQEISHTNSSTHQELKFHTAEPNFFHSDTLGVGWPQTTPRGVWASWSSEIACVARGCLEV